MTPASKGTSYWLPLDLMVYVVALAIVLWPLYILGWRKK
jgi:hypothetical protein